LTRPKILHSQYLGDRTVQQLGQEPVENAVVLNNAANAIGDPLMALAKGSPLQRFDSVNQDDNVGTARRSLLDSEANRDGSNTIKTRTGEQLPANDPLEGTPRGADPLPPIYPPPFGCVPVGGGGINCIWTTSPTPPTQYQSHGNAVINENGLALYLHCKDGVVPPQGLGCGFLTKWQCFGGVCYFDANGSYNSKAECEAALIPSGVTITISGTASSGGPLFVRVDIFDPLGLPSSTYSHTMVACNAGVGCGVDDPTYFQARLIRDGTTEVTRYGNTGWYSGSPIIENTVAIYNCP
jgi:hypothetical protein